jgi:uncharacterized RDD family membrane protein YckC
MDEPGAKPPPRRQESPYPKADLTLRGLARLADVTIALGIALFDPRIGPLVAFSYLLLADGLMQGQSPGKKIFGVKAVVPSTRASAGFQESALRNAPLAVALLLSAYVLFWLAFAVVGLPVLAWQSWQVWNEPQGRHLGDRLAETQVVDAKVLVGATTAAAPGP